MLYIIASSLAVSTNYVLVVTCRGSGLGVDDTTQSIVETYLQGIYANSIHYLKKQAVFARLGNTVWQVDRNGVSKTQATESTNIGYTFCLDRELLCPFSQCLVIHLLKVFFLEASVSSNSNNTCSFFPMQKYFLFSMG